MTDELSPFDFFPRPRTWPTWMLTASRNSGVALPELRQIPARISVNWVKSPNGGAIGVPDPLWDYGNPGHWTEPFLSKPTESASGGILGNMGAELEGPPWFDPGPDMKSIMPWPVWMRAVKPHRKPRKSIRILRVHAISNGHRQLRNERREIMNSAPMVDWQ